MYNIKLEKELQLIPFYYNFFSELEVDEINRLSRQLDSKQASVGDFEKKINDPSIRRSNVRWVECSDQTKWIYSRLEEKVKFINQNYQFDLAGCECIQYTEYNENDAGEYGWHVDYSPICSYKYMRKVSVSVFLTDKTEFDGGDFVMTTTGGDLYIPEQKKGFGVVFPSWLPHRVTPVVEGLRKSLVMWVYGPIFR